MRLGVLDIGSNSAQLQVVEAYPGAPPLPRRAAKEPTSLAEAFDANGAIVDAGVDRVVDAADRVIDIARRVCVERLFTFVTSAVRDATNSESVLARIEEAIGIKPQYLSGEDEARLTYLAARRWHGWSAGRLLVLDIGGGSLEIALGRDAEPDVAVSLPLGAGRLTRAFLTEDPPTHDQVKAMRRHVRDTLREVSDRLHWEGAPTTAVATSKTFKQLARLAGAPPQRRGPFVTRALTTKDLARWIPRLARLKAERRAKLPGVATRRSRQILAGAVVARSVMQALGVKRITVCPWAVREGIMIHYLESRLDQAWTLPLQPVSPDETQAPATIHRLPDALHGPGA